MIRRLLVCGGREFGLSDGERKKFAEAIFTLFERHPTIEEIITGCAPGADKLARAMAIVMQVNCSVFAARWDREGKAAGPNRNQRMIDMGNPDAAVAFPGGRGTADMVARLRKAGIPVWIPYGGVES